MLFNDTADNEGLCRKQRRHDSLFCQKILFNRRRYMYNVLNVYRRYDNENQILLVFTYNIEYYIDTDTCNVYRVRYVASEEILWNHFLQFDILWHTMRGLQLAVNCRRTCEYSRTHERDPYVNCSMYICTYRIYTCRIYGIIMSFQDQ